MENTLKNKIITVIVAAYKAERFIDQALSSILAQELPEGWTLQLLLGIDGCQKTKKAVQKIKDPRLTKYMMKRNRGTYITFNTMMKYAKGEAISRFDADDIMYQGFLYDALLKIEEGYSLIRYKLDVIDQNNKVKGSYPLGYGMVTFSRYAWDIVGGYQPWRCAADSEMINKIHSNPKLKSFSLTNKAYVGYRSFDGSNSLTRAKATTFGSSSRNQKSSYIARANEAWRSGKNLSIKTTPLTGKCTELS